MIHSCARLLVWVYDSSFCLSVCMFVSLSASLCVVMHIFIVKNMNNAMPYWLKLLENNSTALTGNFWWKERTNIFLVIAIQIIRETIQISKHIPLRRYPINFYSIKKIGCWLKKTNDRAAFGFFYRTFGPKWKELLDSTE